jgi:hypothetical protein
MSVIAVQKVRTTPVADIKHIDQPLRGNSQVPASALERVDLARDDDADHTLARGLAGYLSAVAETIGLGTEGVTFEVSDTATAYLALEQRSSSIPDRDLMLIWDERGGWRIAVETDPDEVPITLACLGPDILPTPRAVARFVSEPSVSHQVNRRRSHTITRGDLSARLRHFRTRPSVL